MSGAQILAIGVYLPRGYIGRNALDSSTCLWTRMPIVEISDYKMGGILRLAPVRLNYAIITTIRLLCIHSK